MRSTKELGFCLLSIYDFLIFNEAREARGIGFLFAEYDFLIFNVNKACEAPRNWVFVC